MEKEELSVSGEREQFEKWLGTETCEVHIDESANKNAWYGWQAAARLYREKGREWIPVSERLPEPEEDVIVFVTDDMDGHKNFVNVDTRRCETDEVWADGTITHWMPLPAPPKEK